jgi:hypothetical protein
MIRIESTVAAEHVVLIVIAAAGAYQMTNMAIGPANSSTVALLRPKQVIA